MLVGSKTLKISIHIFVAAKFMRIRRHLSKLPGSHKQPQREVVERDKENEEMEFWKLGKVF